MVQGALNDGLVEVDMLDDGEAGGQLEEAETVEGQTLAEKLDEMSRDDLIARAQSLGIDPFPPRTRINTMIAAILARHAEAERSRRCERSRKW